MPYQRRTRYRRRRFSRRGRYGSRGRALVRRRRSRAPYRMGKRLLRYSPEKKAAFAGSTYNSTTTGVVIGLTGLIEGFSNSQRVGRKVNPLSLYTTFDIVWNNAAPLDSGLRIMLVRDNRQIADTTPTLLEIFGTGTPPLPEAYTGTNKGRFISIWDKLILDRSQAVGTPYRYILRKAVKLFGNWYYNGAGASDIEKNGLYIVMWYTSNTNLPSVTLASDLRFQDN